MNTARLNTINRIDKPYSNDVKTYRHVDGNEVIRVGDICIKNNRFMAQQMEIDSMYFYSRCKTTKDKIKFSYKGKSFFD